MVLPYKRSTQQEHAQPCFCAGSAIVAHCAGSIISRDITNDSRSWHLQIVRLQRPRTYRAMFRSVSHHGAPTDESDDKHEQGRTDQALVDSLASIPAGLEVVPSNDKHFYQAEKETVQVLPEAISQDGKEVSEIWAPPHEALALPEAPRAERRRCGLAPRYFWAVTASLVLALALAVGLASGLGVRRSRKPSTCDSCMHHAWAVIRHI